jgi:hypothetical protein
VLKQLPGTELNKALMDEYHVRDTYRKTIEIFGKIRPLISLSPLPGTGDNDSGKSW